ncbi:MAG: ParB/RepB/Spo0J family partition protein [bacterium]
MERRALGKGLAALLSDQVDLSMVRQVPLTQITANPHQPRRLFEPAQLHELAESIKLVGVLQPIIVRQTGNDQYELVAGERRLRASELAGLQSIPVIVRTADSQAMLEMALIENLQRQDISAIDAAWAYKKLIDEFGLTHEQVATRLGKSRSAITNALRLLQLPEEARTLLGAGKITEGHARALLSVNDPEVRRSLLQEVTDKSLSVRQAEKRAKELTKPSTLSKPSIQVPIGNDPEWKTLERRLRELFGARVQVQRVPPGGRIVIEFFDEEDLGRIMELLGLF